MLICIGVEPEQPVRLDHLEPFVHQRRRIDRDLRAHVPGRVLQRFGNRRRFHRGFVARAKRAAGRRQNQPAHFRTLLAAQALMQRVVFRIDRQQSRRRISPPRASSTRRPSPAFLCSPARRASLLRARAESAQIRPRPPFPTRHISASSRVATSTKPASPTTIAGAETARTPSSIRSRSAVSSDSTETSSGLNFAIWSASFSMLRPAPSATTRKRSRPSASITRRVLQPIEPVEPRMEIPRAVMFVYGDADGGGMS